MTFLIDGDNNIGTGLKGIELLTPEDTVLIFHQKNQITDKIKKLCAESAAKIQCIESVQSGRNSIDFQIIAELGVLVGSGKADYAYIISQDKGYEASIAALHARYGTSFQEVALQPSIEDCLKMAYVLRASSCQELCNALVRECGAARGQLLYNHLKRLFSKPEASTAPRKKTAAESSSEATAAKAPEAAVKVARTRRGSRRRKPAAADASEVSSQ